MRLKTFKSTRSFRGYSYVFWVAVVLYAALFAGVFLALDHKTNKQNGQLVSGQSTGLSYTNLDLRVAAKNKYPSSSLAVVKELGSSNGVAEKIISFKVPVDGLTEYGLMMLPAAPPPSGGYPAIILCHGYLNPGHYSTTLGYLNDMRFYAEHGFAVIKPDYRGQGLSDHQGQADSAYYSMAYNTDVMSLITALKQTDYINKSRLNLWGHSMGAYIALRAAILSPDIKNVILLSGPVDSLSKMYLSYIPPSDENNLQALKTRQEVFTKYGTPAETTAFWINASPINLIGRAKAHFQIHVGALDQVVPPQFSADLDASLTQRHIKHDYYVYADGDHSLFQQRSLIWARSLPALQAAPASDTPSA